jgi:hypothetical protein
MPTYTVHAPPPKQGEAASAPERFRFVRDGFHFWAFVFPPLWLLAYRLWLALVIYVVGYGAIAVALAFAGATPNMQLAAAVLIHLLMGFEASSIRRWTYARRKCATLGFVVGEDEETAEQRFYAEWSKRAAAAPEPPPQEPAYATPVRRGPPTGSDVIGLFPEPGAPR